MVMSCDCVLHLCLALVSPTCLYESTSCLYIVASDESVSLIQQMLNHYVAARWYQMGVVLGVPPSDLEIIRESPEYHGAGEREAGMLKAWLERGILPRTWQVRVIECALKPDMEVTYYIVNSR